VLSAGGGYSIDVNQRMPGISWWPDEQLNFRQMTAATEMYADLKPDIVVTHQCPESIEDTIFDFPHRYTNATSKFLDALFELHRPKLWVFGHYHLSRNRKVKKTRFVCVRPLEVFEA
jgi:Icc-related predicted phosphoesterase